MAAACPLSLLLEAYQKARNRGQEAVLNRKTVNYIETVSFYLTTNSTESAASPLSLLLESYQEARKQGQEAVLIRKSVKFVETVFLSLVSITSSVTQKPEKPGHSPGWQTPKATHKPPSTVKRNGKRRQKWLLARNQLLSSPANTPTETLTSGNPEPFSSPYPGSSPPNPT